MNWSNNSNHFYHFIIVFFLLSAATLPTEQQVDALATTGSSGTTAGTADVKTHGKHGNGVSLKF